MRTVGCQGIEPGTPIDVDIAFVQKSTIKPFATHDAVADKLNSVKETYGEPVYHETIGSIVLAKRLLKESGAYKKLDGGFGGVGVENWILQHGGNITEAFQSFWDAAHSGGANTGADGGAAIPLEEFKQKYKLLDAGENLAFPGHDNFIQLHLEEGAYQKILSMIQRELKLA